jgi:hypothetical protein
MVYGGGGDMDWQILDERTCRPAPDFRDEGPGIPDIKLAMTDGWTSAAVWAWGLRARNGWSMNSNRTPSPARHSNNDHPMDMNIAGSLTQVLLIEDSSQIGTPGAPRNGSPR